MMKTVRYWGFPIGWQGWWLQLLALFVDVKMYWRNLLGHMGIISSASLGSIKFIQVLPLSVYPFLSNKPSIVHLFVIYWRLNHLTHVPFFPHGSKLLSPKTGWWTTKHDQLFWGPSIPPLFWATPTFKIIYTYVAPPQNRLPSGYLT